MSSDLSSSNSSFKDSLYPPIEPYKTHFLKVSNIHTIHVEEVGNPDGNPVLFLHGGPGGGIATFYRQFFDPKAYRVILIDQRGSGKSTPAGCVENNTTWDLVEDCETVRKHCAIEKWIVFGGSWLLFDVVALISFVYLKRGSTLALAYAETHVDRVKAMILRGIFCCRNKEIHWLYQEGASYLFPDQWDNFLAPIPVVERNNLLNAYYRRIITGKDEKEKAECVKAWAQWEVATSYFYLNKKSIEEAATDYKGAIQCASIEIHYFVNNGFLETDDQLLKNAEKIRDIPGIIVQGRYDAECPPITAWELNKIWKKAELIFVGDAGHSCEEPGIIKQLVIATEKYKNL